MHRHGDEDRRRSLFPCLLRVRIVFPFFSVRCDLLLPVIELALCQFCEAGDRSVSVRGEMGTAYMGMERIFRNRLQMDQRWRRSAGGRVEDLGLAETPQGSHFSQHEAACGASVPLGVHSLILHLVALTLLAHSSHI